VLNKADLRDQWEVQDTASLGQDWTTLETSAKTGRGVEQMFLALAGKLVDVNSTLEDAEE
jgi:hypothetical protein